VDKKLEQLDYARTEPPKRVAWYKYKFSAMDLAAFLFLLALAIYLLKMFSGWS
jgi:hypothetical protein